MDFICRSAKHMKVTELFKLTGLWFSGWSYITPALFTFYNVGFFVVVFLKVFLVKIIFMLTKFPVTGGLQKMIKILNFADLCHR